MSLVLDLAETADLIADVARANILAALLDGRAATARELAYAARVTPQTASAHLAKLVDGAMLTVDRQGRHRYFRLASPQVARTLETILELAAASPRRVRPPRMAPDMRRARTCYDHVAGEVGVAIADALLVRGAVVFDGEAGEVTSAGEAFFAAHGIETAQGASRRIFCRPCIDWSERRPHLGGRVGAALCAACLAQGWLAARPGSRTLDITRSGSQALPAVFGPGLQTVCDQAVSKVAPDAGIRHRGVAVAARGVKLRERRRTYFGTGS